MRFSQTEVHKAPSEVVTLYNSIRTRSQRMNRTSDLRRVVLAWIACPDYGNVFSQMTMTLRTSTKVEKEEEWVSRKVLLTQYDSSEAEELVSTGAIAVRSEALGGQAGRAGTQVFKKDSLRNAGFPFQPCIMSSRSEASPERIGEVSVQGRAREDGADG
jgi:hypothetical protein